MQLKQSVRFITVGAAIILFAGVVGYSLTIPAKHESNNEGSSALSSSSTKAADYATTTRIATTRRYLSRDELLAADWKLAIREIWVPEKVWGWGQFGDYAMQLQTPNTISIREKNSSNTVHFSTDKILPNGKPPIGFSEQPVYPSIVLANNITKHLYAFFTFGTTHLGGAWGLYESDFFGKNAKEILLHYDFKFPQSFRFSPDGTTMAFVVDNTFYVVDLLAPTRIVSFEIPGNLDQYVNEKHLTEDERALATNWVAAWQFTPEGNVEFTQYFARGTQLSGYSQQSDKELWTYDIGTGALTMLETVPLHNGAQ